MVLKKYVALLLLSSSSAAFANCPPEIESALGLDNYQAPVFGSCPADDPSCGQIQFSSPGASGVDNLVGGTLKHAGLGLDTTAVPDSNGMYQSSSTHKNVTVYWLEPEPPLLHIGPPRYDCDRSTLDPIQPKPKDTIPLPQAAYTSTPTYVQVIDRIGGEGLSELYDITSGHFTQFQTLYAADRVSGSTTYENNCSSPLNPEAIGDFQRVSCNKSTSASPPGNYVVYRKNIPKDCSDLPGYQYSAGACHLFAEAATLKPSGVVPCEVYTRSDGSVQKDPHNPDCSVADVQVSGNKVTMTNGSQKLEVATTSSGGAEFEFSDGTSWKRISTGPYSAALGGRPINSVVSGQGSGPGVGDGSSDPPSTGGSGGDGDGDSDVTEPDLAPYSKSAEDVLNPLLNMLPEYQNFQLSLPSGVCPTSSFDLFDETFVFDSHCGLLEEHRDFVSLISLLMYSVSSLFIVLRA